jgi:hypothetical protein
MPANSRRIDGDPPYQGTGYTSSTDGYLAPEYHTTPTAMDAGANAQGNAVTVMTVKNSDGAPYGIPVDSPNLPAGFPTQYADADGFLPADWKLVPDASSPTGNSWEPL